MFMMQPSSNDDNNDKQEPPKVMYDTGHDNTVFVGDSTTLPQPHLSRPNGNGTTNSYYPNGITNGHANGNYPNGNPQQQQQTFRIIENSRL